MDESSVISSRLALLSFQQKSKLNKGNDKKNKSDKKSGNAKKKTSGSKLRSSTS